MSPLRHKTSSNYHAKGFISIACKGVWMYPSGEEVFRPQEPLPERRSQKVLVVGRRSFPFGNGLYSNAMFVFGRVVIIVYCLQKFTSITWLTSLLHPPTFLCCLQQSFTSRHCQTKGRVFWWARRSFERKPRLFVGKPSIQIYI